MNKRLGRTQRKILSTLERIKREEKKEWVSVNILIIMTYHPWQIDPRHKDYKGKDWSYSPTEHTTILRAVRGLERRGLVETRIVKVGKDTEYGPRWGGVTRWKEVRFVMESHKLE